MEILNTTQVPFQRVRMLNNIFLVVLEYVHYVENFRGKF